MLKDLFFEREMFRRNFAVVKDPFLSGDARGSVGGMTASIARGGHIMKRKPHPSTQYRPGITRVRSIMGYLSRQWGELTVAQREFWNSWAVNHPGTDKFGDPFIMSGINAFIQLNHKAIWIDDASAMSVIPPEDPPASAIDLLTAVIGVVAAGDIDLSWTEIGTGIAADFWEIQRAGPFQSQGRISVTSQYVHVGQVAGNVLLETIENMAEGFWYWFRVRYVAADGQVSAWTSAQQTPKLTV